MRKASLVIFLAFAAAPSARAQVDVGTGIGPEQLGLGDPRPSREKPSVLPLALAASLVWDATTWTRLELSTSTAPAEELTSLIQKGYYRLELLQIVLIAEKAGKPLSSVTELREKGKGLRELASSLGADFDSIYDRSLELDRRIEADILPSIMTVSASGAKRKEPLE